MSAALAISEVGMINDLRALDTIAHNLANANTAAFKREIAVNRSFDAALDAQFRLAESSALAIGTATVPRFDTVPDATPGVFRATGNPLDLAIEGDAYFVLTGSGGTFYGRQGSLSLDAGGRLTNSQGLTVSGVEGEIRLSGNAPRIDATGRIFEGDEQLGQLQLVRFPDAARLDRAGAGLYIGNGAQPLTDGAARVRQGFLEASNVPVMEEMVRLITTARHFEMTQRVARAYEEMIGTAIESIADF